MMNIIKMNKQKGYDEMCDNFNPVLLELRGATMERCYSMREGHYIPERDDIMPERFFQETIYNKYNEPKKLDKKEFFEKRKGLYHSYGLQDDGTPSAEFLEQLGLGFAIPVMEEALKK